MDATARTSQPQGQLESTEPIGLWQVLAFNHVIESSTRALQKKNSGRVFPHK